MKKTKKIFKYILFVAAAILVGSLFLGMVSVSLSNVTDNVTDKDDSGPIKLAAPTLRIVDDTIEIIAAEENKGADIWYKVTYEGNTGLASSVPVSRNENGVFYTSEFSYLTGTVKFFVCATSTSDMYIDSDYVLIEYTFPEEVSDKPVVRIDGDTIYVTPVADENSDIQYYRLYIEGIYPDMGYWCMIDGSGSDLSALLSDEVSNNYRIESGTYKIYVQGCNDLTDYRTNYSSFVEYNFQRSQPSVETYDFTNSVSIGEESTVFFRGHSLGYETPSCVSYDVISNDGVISYQIVDEIFTITGLKAGTAVIRCTVVTAGLGGVGTYTSIETYTITVSN